jgi:hypothetical protein
MEQTLYSETSAIKHHTPENNPKDYTQHSFLFHCNSGYTTAPQCYVFTYTGCLDLAFKRMAEDPYVDRDVLV